MGGRVGRLLKAFASGVREHRKSPEDGLQLPHGQPGPTSDEEAVRHPKCQGYEIPKTGPCCKATFTKEQKQADTSLAKLHTLILDAIAPIVHILEEANRGTLSTEQAAEAAKSTVVLLGNASVHMSKERRCKVIDSLNKKVPTLWQKRKIYLHKGSASTTRQSFRGKGEGASGDPEVPCRLGPQREGGP